MRKCINCPGRFLVDTGRWVLFPCEGVSRWMAYRECSRCKQLQPLGHSNDAPVAAEIEIRLAELLAETECEWEPCGAKDEQFDLYVDIFAENEPPQLRRPGPRSPIEMMVDAACGYEHAQDEER